MKGKITLPLVILLLLMCANLSVTISESSITIVYVDPPAIAVPVGSTFTVNISIASVESLDCFAFSLGYNTTILDCLKVVQGPFFPPPPRSFGSVEINDALGFVWVTFSLRHPEPAKSGNGTLATVTFKCTRVGESPLHFYDSQIYDPNVNLIAHETKDGYVKNGIEPVADFDWHASTHEPKHVLVCKNVTFNASASYDPDGWIESYVWNFSDGTPIVTESDPITTHHFTEPGDYNVCLTVFDNDGLSNAKCKSIHVIEYLNATIIINSINHTLNLWSQGSWTTVYIELPESYDVSDIDVSTILMNETIPVDLEAPVTIGDFDNDTIPDLMVKFDREAVILYILDVLGIPTVKFSNVTLTVTGKLFDGTRFKDSERIRVIWPSATLKMKSATGNTVWTRVLLFHVKNVTLKVPKPLHDTVVAEYGTDTFTASFNLTLSPTNPTYILEVTIDPPGVTLILNPMSPSDVDGNGRVDYKDLFRLATSYGASMNKPAHYDIFTDFNIDLKVDFADLFQLAGNYGKTY